MRTLIHWLELMVFPMFAFASALVLPERGWLKRRVAHRLGEITGRPVTIAGELDIQVTAWRLTFRAEQLRIANTPWGQAPDLLKARVAEIYLDLRDLLRGRLTVSMIRLMEPGLFLEVSPQGQPNWVFHFPTEDRPINETGPMTPVIEQLQIQDGHLVYNNRSTTTAITAHLETITGPSPQDARLRLQAAGQWQGMPVKLELSGGSRLAPRVADDPYPLCGHLELGTTRVRLEGQVAQPLAFQGVDLDVTVQGQDLRWLAPTLTAEWPEGLPYEWQGRLRRSDEATWRWQALRGRIGNSDLQGEVTVAHRGGRPTLDITLSSQTLDLTPWRGLLVAFTDQPVATGAPTPERQEGATRFGFSGLPLLDITLELQAETLLVPQLQVKSTRVNLSVQRGCLHLEPMRFTLGTGRARHDGVLATPT